MKKLLLYALLLISYLGYSQDIIILHENGSEIKSKVIEINETTIKYKKWENINGPTYNIQISLVSMIKYINGQQDIFDDNTISSASDNQKDKINESSKNINREEKEYPILPLKYVPYYYSNQNNSLKELETVYSKTERKRAGAWGHKTFKTIHGITSNIRISKRVNLQFLIQLEDSKENPHSICELNLCEIKGERQVMVYTDGAHGKIKQNGIPLEFKKLNENGLYLITFPKRINKGEYFFSITDENEVYAFGLDK